MFFGQFASINLILSDDIPESILIPSSGPFRMYVGKQESKVTEVVGREREPRTSGRVAQ